MIHKWCLVTGTSSGIGRALAALLLEHDWEVVGVARRDVDLQHPHYTHLRLDLGDAVGLTETFDAAFAAKHQLAERARVGLVNNAALLSPVGPLEELPFAELQHSFTVNTVTPLWLMGYFLRQRPGKLLRMVNVSSGAAYNARAGWTSYCSTKAALLMGAQVLGKEWEDYAVARGGKNAMKLQGVMNYSPGIVDTEMQQQVRTLPDTQFPGVQRFQEFHEKGQLVSPEMPSGEILDYLENDEVAPFSDGRFGG